MGKVFVGKKDDEYYVFDDLYLEEMPDLEEYKEDCIKNKSNATELIFDKWCDIDELMVLPIIELNKKGYYTESSCADHYFGSSASSDSEEIDDCYYVSGNPENPDKMVYFGVSQSPRSGAHVLFNENYIFDSLPESWKLNKTEMGTLLSVSYEYERSDPYGFFMSQVCEIKKLYEWAQNLPNIKENGVR